MGVRLAAIAVVAAGAASLALFHRGAIDPSAIRDAVAGSSVAPLIFVLLQIAASLLFVPRTVLGIAAGLMFGLAWGAVWANLGAIAGAAAGFAFVRWLGAGTVDLEATPKLGPLLERAERGGWRAVAILRLIPGLPHSVVNTALGLTRISWRDYLIGSFLGMLPMTLVQVDIGVAGGEAFTGHSGWMVVSLLLAIAFAASFLVKRAVSNRG
jgi:uncharacterized membrane protein YdjX (TVP38/TMEM64 family)